MPTPEAIERGLEIKALIEEKWSAPPFFYHLRHGGHVAALRAHTNNTLFFRADIDDFFGRIGRSRVTRCLKTYVPYAVARDIANLSLVKHPDHGRFILPYGFVQSPVLASLALDKSRLGKLLRRLSSAPQFAVSVYVDDIIVSSKSSVDLQQAAETLIDLASKALLPIGESKREGPSESVEAFNIQLSQDSLEITPERMDLFRSRYLIASSESVRAGIRGYVISVNPVQSDF